MTKLEQQFHAAMIHTYEEAKRACKYNATYFLRMVTDFGAVEAAKRLLQTDKPSEGFGTLFLCKRLDLTVEAKVIQPEFAELFAESEIETAKQRLREYGYPLGSIKDE